jgi:hypothetical protein
LDYLAESGSIREAGDPVADHVRTFLEAEIEALEPFGFVLARPSGQPLHVIEVTRLEDRGLEVHVPGRPPFVPALTAPVRRVLDEAGFTCEDASDPTRPWVKGVADPAAAVEIVQRLLSDAFGEKPEVSLDIVHGSHRLEHEARLKLAAVRERIQRVGSELLGHAPPQDADGDYLLGLGDVHVIVAPRAMPGGPLVVRVFAITNSGVQVVPELGLFLARLNFGLAFGRFALDAENASIWYDETLLGDQFSDDDLRFTIRVVATTADEWDDRLKQMFGGTTYQESLRAGTQDKPPAKPGQGGYL